MSSAKTSADNTEKRLALPAIVLPLVDAELLIDMLREINVAAKQRSHSRLIHDLHIK
jgi:hypothetical protein